MRTDLASGDLDMSAGWKLKGPEPSLFFFSGVPGFKKGVGWEERSIVSSLRNGERLFGLKARSGS
jgi:hypothetical protein